MTSANWMDLVWIAVGLYGLLAAALALVTARQAHHHRQARHQERRAIVWINRGLGAAAAHERTVVAESPLVISNDANTVQVATGELLALTEALVPRFEVIGDLASLSARGEWLARELRRILLPILKDGLTKLERPTIFGTQKRLVRCLRLLTFVPAPEILPALLGASTFRDPVIAVEALRALGHGSRYYEAAVVPLTSRCRAAERNKNYGAVYLMAVWALTQVLGDHPRNAPMLAADPSASVRRLAMWAAASKIATRPDGESTALTAVVERATRDADATVRAAAVRAQLSQNTLQKAPAILRVALEDPDEEVRLAGLDHGAILWAKEDETSDPNVVCEIVHLLVSALDQDSPRLSNAVARSLKRLPPAQASEPAAELIRNAGSRPWPENRTSFQALGYLAYPTTAEALLPGLEAPQPELRRQMARTIASLARTVYPDALGEEVAEQLLVRLAEERDAQVLAALLEAVTFTTDGRAVPHLMAKIPHAPNALRERLVEAIATLGRIRPMKGPHEFKNV